MSKEMICPFCGQNLRQSKHQEPYTGQNPYFCDTHDCYSSECFVGTKELWQALIQAKQDLEIATKALKEIKKVCDGCRWCDSNLYDPTPNDGRRIAETTNNALKQIEHKEQI